MNLNTKSQAGLRALILGVGLFFSTSALAASASIVPFQTAPLDYGTTPLASMAASGVYYDVEQAWIAMINSATTRLDIEMMYVADDPTTPSPSSFDPVYTAIVNAAVRGVDVRLLVDASFYNGVNASYTRYVNALASTAHVQARTLDYSAVTGAGIVHSKFFVVDGQTSYVGSSNFDWRAISGTPNAGGHNCDDGMRVDDCAAGGSLVSMFEKDWSLGTPVPGGATYSVKALPVCTITGSTGLSVALSPNHSTYNPSGIPYTLDKITGLIDGARSSIQVVVYKFTSFNYVTYLNDWYLLFNALKNAANRGVAVKVIVDASSAAYSSDLQDLQNLDTTPNAQVKVITLPPYYADSTRTTQIAISYGRVVHDKFMLVDYNSSSSPNPNSGVLGNENWERGYFLESRNASVNFTNNPSLSNTLNSLFSALWSLPSPQAVRASNYVPPPPPQ